LTNKTHYIQLPGSSTFVSCLHHIAFLLSLCDTSNNLSNHVHPYKMNNSTKTRTRKRQPRKQRPKRRRTQASALVPSSRARLADVSIRRSPLIEGICSRVDPFCRASIGIKQNDESSAYSTPYRAVGWYSVSSDTNGNGAFWFNASPNFGVASVSSINNGTGVITWNAAGAYPFYSNNISGKFTEYRVVSFGLKIMTTQAWTAAQGVLNLNIMVADPTGGTACSVNSLTNGYDGQTYPLRDANLYFLSKPTDMTWREYIPVADEGVVTGELVPWTSLLIAFSGATASTTPITVEYVINYELQAAPASLGTNFAVSDMTTPFSKQANELAVIAQSKLPSIVATSLGQGDSTFNGIVKNVARETIALGADYYFPGFGGRFVKAVM